MTNSCKIKKIFFNKIPTMGMTLKKLSSRNPFENYLAKNSGRLLEWQLFVLR